MLGKGLESLIPPRQSSDEHGTGQASPNGDDYAGGASVPQEPPAQHDFTAYHPAPAPPSGAGEDGADSGPQILSYEFAQPFSQHESSGGRASGDLATPVVARQNAPEESIPVRPIPAETPRPADTKAGDYIFHIETAKVRPNPNQPRRDFNEAGLWELAKSIREFGFLQPLVVTRREKETNDGVDVEYELIAGERRLLAAKMLGLEHVPAIVRNINLEREKLELSIIENIQREDLNPIERARAFQRLQEEFRLTQREIAAKLGKSRETVANTVRLLDLPAYIQDAVVKGDLTESHGRFLLQIDDPAAQKKLFDDIVAQRLTTRAVRERVQSSRPKSEKPQTSPELKALEEKLTAELGTPVKIEPASPSLGGKGANIGGSIGLTAGKITITFYSEEELRNIVERFGGQESL